MDWQIGFNLLFGAFCALSGWVLKTHYEGIRDLWGAVNSIREAIGKDYLQKDDFHRFEERLWSRLDGLDGKLDRKMDKE